MYSCDRSLLSDIDDEEERAIYSISSVRCASNSKSPSAPASSSEPSFVGASAATPLPRPVMLRCLQHRRMMKGCHLLLLVILARAPDRISRLFKAHSRSHGLVVALGCLGAVRRRHVRPSGGVVHRHGPLLRRLDHTGVRVGRGGSLPWRRRRLRCTRIRSPSATDLR